MDPLSLITCTPAQSQTLQALGINARGVLYFVQALDVVTIVPAVKGAPPSFADPAWTFAELGAMIGPAWEKPDLWNDQHERRKETAQDPHAYPVYKPATCEVYTNGAQAAAAGLIYLLENNILAPQEANKRHQGVFKQLY